ncbi:hypothetical protein BDQ17DRAFT_1436113 [Cyathus striatus]|nr:hypothetical protein BDQ17DRAFT_1436113 [Cyathus striatus]
MSEIVSVFKTAQLRPLFRDQLTNFGINQIASNVWAYLPTLPATVSTGGVQELQDVLEFLSVLDRLRKSSEQLRVLQDMYRTLISLQTILGACTRALSIPSARNYLD